MRIADKMNYDQVTSNLSRNRAEIADLQNQAATQKRVTKPSDDPLAATRVLAARTEINGNSQYQKNVNQAKAFLEYSDQSLSELAETVMRAKELAIGQANDASANKDSRESVAAEISQLRGQAVQIGNRKLGDRFLFGGYRTTRPPFDPQGQYLGDEGEIRVIINKEADIAMNIPGSRIFYGRALKEVDSQEVNYQPKQGPGLPNEAIPEAEAKALRGPATDEEGKPLESNLSATWQSEGVNLFKVLKDLEIGLRTNDKVEVQDSLDKLDSALAQVVLARAQIGSRVMTLDSAAQTLQKGSVDAKALASSLEEVDNFELVTNMNKSENTLKASLASSSKLIQPSLLDFLR